MNSKGFSLMEACIALIIIGLIMGGMMQGYRIYQADQVLGKTYGNMLNVESALADFYIANERYPCPASRFLGPGDPDYGREISPCTTPVPNNCDITSGICRATGAAGGQVLIGSVPFVTLKIPDVLALDGYKRKLTYGVSQVLTDRSTFDVSLGAIQSVPILAPLTPSNPQPDYALGATDPVRNHFVLLSHGGNGKGAYTIDGVLYRACDGQGYDLENCDNDAAFVYGDILKGAGIREMDDNIHINSQIPVKMWEYSAVNNENIFSKFYVGIGTDIAGARLDRNKQVVRDGANKIEYNNQISLDVAGNIKADNANASYLCDVDGVRGGGNIGCFKAEEIMGDHGLIRCNDDQAVRQIQDRRVDCSVTYMPKNQQCPQTQFLVGFNAAGDIICE